MSGIAILLTTTALAQDARVSAETPSEDTAVLLLDSVWSLLPGDGVVVYMDCHTPDCAGQVPEWFELERWRGGLSDGGLILRSTDVGVSEEILELLWQTNHDSPPMLAMSLARRLDANPAAHALLYVRPRAREHRLDLSWEVYEMRTDHPPHRGRLTLRPLPPPLPDFRADIVPYRQHREVWGGAGLLLAGGAMLGGTWGASLESPGLSAINTGGWLTVMGGATLMALPILQRH